MRTAYRNPRNNPRIETGITLFCMLVWCYCQGFDTEIWLERHRGGLLILSRIEREGAVEGWFVFRPMIRGITRVPIRRETYPAQDRSKSP